MEKKEIKIDSILISTMGFEESVKYIVKKAELGEGLRVCFCTLNEIMEAGRDDGFSKILKKVELKTADGMPLVWYMRWKRGSGERVYGPEVMKKLLITNYPPRQAGKLQIKHLFIGSENNKKYFEKYGHYIVLPYKDSFENKDYQKIIREIKKYDSRLIWIGLGAKKQVVVLDELYKRLNDRVYLCVGAAFDFLSGNKKQCPKLIRRIGGEWLFRWVNEPKRLSGRYFRIICFLGNLFLKNVKNKITV